MQTRLKLERMLYLQCLLK